MWKTVPARNNHFNQKGSRRKAAGAAAAGVAVPTESEEVTPAAVKTATKKLASTVAQAKRLPWVVELVQRLASYVMSRVEEQRAGADGPLDVVLKCLGLGLGGAATISGGRVQYNTASLVQLAVFLGLVEMVREALGTSVRVVASTYDPVVIAESLDGAVCSQQGCQLESENCLGGYPVDGNVGTATEGSGGAKQLDFLFAYMIHCPRGLYDNLLAANWIPRRTAGSASEEAKPDALKELHPMARLMVFGNSFERYTVMKAKGFSAAAALCEHLDRFHPAIGGGGGDAPTISGVSKNDLGSAFSDTVLMTWRGDAGGLSDVLATYSKKQPALRTSGEDIL